jgi:ribosomal protein S14
MIKHLKLINFQKKFYFQKQLLKVLRNETKLNPHIRELSILKLSFLPKRSSKAFNFRYCLETGSKKSVKRFSYLSRMAVKEVFKKHRHPHVGLPFFFKFK